MSSRIHYEIEQKYRISSPHHIRRFIKRIGARKIRSGREYNEFYDIGNVLQKKRSIIRLRRFGSHPGQLTFKGPRLRSRYSKRIEIETPVLFDEMRRMMKFAGFRCVAKYAKKREEFRVLGCVVTLDHFGKFGWFMEIEGKARRIAALSRRLGLKESQKEFRTYLEMLTTG